MPSCQDVLVYAVAHGDNIIQRAAESSSEWHRELCPVCGRCEVSLNAGTGQVACHDGCGGLNFEKVLAAGLGCGGDDLRGLVWSYVRRRGSVSLEDLMRLRLAACRAAPRRLQPTPNRHCEFGGESARLIEEVRGLWER